MKITLKPEDRGRRALVTGASSGIGLEVSRILADLGFDLVISARRVERLESLANELRSSSGADVLVVPADLGDEAAPSAIFDAVDDAGGAPVEVLINNAGVGVPVPFDSDWSVHEGHLRVMAIGPTRLIHLFLPGMLERGYGRVANVTSIMSQAPGAPLHGMYCPSKSFLYKLTQTLATEYLGSGVTFTVTLPGFTESEIIDSAGLRDIYDHMPKFMTASARLVAEQTVQACLAGTTTYTHTWFNRLYCGVMRHYPTRYAHRLMIGERNRVRDQLAGGDGALELPGMSFLRRKR